VSLCMRPWVRLLSPLIFSSALMMLNWFNIFARNTAHCCAALVQRWNPNL
jgi:hypothetical protein